MFTFSVSGVEGPTTYDDLFVITLKEWQNIAIKNQRTKLRNVEKRFESEEDNWRKM